MTTKGRNKMKFRFQNIRNIFKDKRLAAAFSAVKFDMDNLEENQTALKMSTNDWIVFLDEENRYLKTRIKDLERKVDSMQYRPTKRSEEHELAVLRTI